MYVKYSAILSLCLFIPEFKMKQQKKIIIISQNLFALINLSNNSSFFYTTQKNTMHKLWIYCNYINLYLMTQIILFDLVCLLCALLLNRGSCSLCDWTNTSTLTLINFKFKAQYAQKHIFLQCITSVSV